jgi:predicted acylesterase/phospholipase RssA/CRP-like cAMP-binding protein
MSHLRTTLSMHALSDELHEALRALFGEIDHDALLALARRAEFTALESGAVLCRQGEAGDCLFILLTGRLQAVRHSPDGVDHVVAEIGRSELVGEMSFFSGEPRSATVYALRDCVVLAYSREVFDDIVASFPQVTSRVIKLLVRRLQRSSASRPDASRVSNIALIPLTPGLLLREFGARLVAELEVHDRTQYLDSGRVDTALGEDDAAQALADAASGPRLSAWLDEQERAHRYVVYAADPTASEWTERCIRQADWVLVVADAKAHGVVEEIDRLLASGDGRATVHRTFVLVHDDGGRLPTNTRRWLDGRAVRDHLHVRWSSPQDFARLARRLARRAVGLVLGGGGARGFAHIGVLRALDEGNVPVDMIGGTSMGAFIGGQYAMGLDQDTMLANFRRVWLEMKPQYEVTLPLVSFVGNKKAMQCGRLLYGDTEIEDCWIDFFCVSSNLTRAEMRVHRTGLLRMATLASASLPVFAPPIVDASNLLVDGGLVNNLPTDVITSLGADFVMACKVSVDQDEAFMADRVPTPWEIMRRRLLGRRQPRVFPSLIEMLGRATMLGAIRQEAVAIEQVDLAFCPPVEQFGLLDFGAIDRVVESGYRYAKRTLEAIERPAWWSSSVRTRTDAPIARRTLPATVAHRT